MYPCSTGNSVLLLVPLLADPALDLCGQIVGRSVRLFFLRLSSRLVSGLLRDVRVATVSASGRDACRSLRRCAYSTGPSSTSFEISASARPASARIAWVSVSKGGRTRVTGCSRMPPASTRRHLFEDALLRDARPA